MFPPIEPFRQGSLKVDDLHSIYWEVSGNPQGTPAVFLHGGPGGGIKAGYRRRFDPEKYLIVSFEQRGCGRSRPLVSDVLNLSSNTTQHLISDIEALRKHLGISKWLVTGVSWGTTLALAYAQSHPDCVLGLVLTAVTTTSESEVQWITEGMGQFFPGEWEEFAAAVENFEGQRLIDRYWSAITDADPEVRMRAADAWCKWEDTHVSLDPNWIPNSDFQDANYRIQFATLVIHYWKHAGFLKNEPILSKMDLISEIPGVLIHGRLDISSPSQTAFGLHKAWPASRLLIHENEGHGGPEMMEEMAIALSNFPLATDSKLI